MWDSWDIRLRSWLNWRFWKPHISAVPHQNFMKIFLVTLLWQKSIWYFMVHVWAPHQFWENEHGQNHENPKMPLSLASSSDVARIVVMTHIDFLDLGLWLELEPNGREAVRSGTMSDLNGLGILRTSGLDNLDMLAINAPSDFGSHCYHNFRWG